MENKRTGEKQLERVKRESNKTREKPREGIRESGITIEGERG